MLKLRGSNIINKKVDLTKRAANRKRMQARDHQSKGRKICIQTLRSINLPILTIEMKFTTNRFLTTSSLQGKKMTAGLVSGKVLKETHSINRDTASKVDPVRAKKQWLKRSLNLHKDNFSPHKRVVTQVLPSTKLRVSTVKPSKI